MSNTEEPTQTESPSRRKFVLSVAVLSAFAALLAAVRIPFPAKKNAIACAPESKKKMIKMLTQDGRLVEIDEAFMNAGRRKVTNTELQHWIKK